MEAFGLLLVGLGIVTFLCALPLLGVLFGALTGFVISCVPFAATWVVHGLGVFGVTLSPSDLVSVGAALGFVGGFFKSIQTNSNSK